jgi:hypothetical protein
MLDQESTATFMIYFQKLFRVVMSLITSIVALEISIMVLTGWLSRWYLGCINRARILIMQAPNVGQYKSRKKGKDVWVYSPNYGLPYVCTGSKRVYLYCQLEDPHTLYLPVLSTKRAIESLLINN